MAPDSGPASTFIYRNSVGAVPVGLMPIPEGLLPEVPVSLLRCCIEGAIDASPPSLAGILKYCRSCTVMISCRGR